MHYYQFNIGDYASHTKGLSLLEDLAYRRLIDEYYLAERPFNGCSTDVARKIGMREHADEVAYILTSFFEEADGQWVHKRMDQDIAAFKNKAEKASKAGKASAEARKNKGSEQTFNERSTDVQPTNNHKPITNNHKPKEIQVAKAPKFDFRKSLIVQGVEEDVADTWLAVRKKKKASNSELAFNAVRREAIKANVSMNNAILMCCENSWSGFKAEWLKNEQAKQRPGSEDFIGKHTNNDWAEGL